MVFKIFICLCIILISLLIIDNIIINNSKVTKEHFYLSMTTIPDRLTTKWFENNLKQTLKCNGNFTIILNIPLKTMKNKPYVIPKSIDKMQNSNFIIHRCKDEGPITKLLPTLRNKKIRDNSIIIICDDDIIYKKNTFNLLKNNVVKHPTGISTPTNIPFSKNKIEGFKCFGFKKNVLIDLINLKIPKCCIRIDDDIIQNYVQCKKIPIFNISYGKLGLAWTLNEFKTLISIKPEWSNLNNDDRTIMKKICKQKILQSFI